MSHPSTEQGRMSTHIRNSNNFGGGGVSNHGRVDAAGGLHDTSVRSGGKSTSSSTKSLMSGPDLDIGSQDTANSNSNSSTGGGMSDDGEPEYKLIANLNTIPLWLAPCHLVAAIFQFMQAFILFAFSSLTVDLKWVVVTNFPVPYSQVDQQEDDLLYNYDEEDEPIVYAQPGEPHIVGYYSVTWLAAFFILCSGIDHITCLLPGLRARYEYYVERHQSPFRWVEYSISAALIRVCICQIAGVTDLHLMFSIFVMTATSIFFPLLHERSNAKARADGHPQDWLGLCFGVFAHLATWSIIFCYYFTSISRGEPPAFVSTVVISLFLLDCTFPICFILQWKKVGVFKDYLAGEFGFILLSFTSKTFLAWVTLVGSQAFANVA